METGPLVYGCEKSKKATPNPLDRRRNFFQESMDGD
jgi:hypothetical protein